MSATEATATGRGPRGEIVLLGLIAAAGLAVLLYVSSGRQQALRASAVGFDGLQVWLTSEGQSARSFTGGWVIDPDGIGLLVQPLYDTALSYTRTRPKTEEELLLQEDEYDLRRDPITDKIDQLPSLIVLPKWRSGMRLTGQAHPILLDDPKGATATLWLFFHGTGSRVRHIPEPFVDFTYRAGPEELTARLYVPQVFTSPNCEPIIGTGEAIVLGRCRNLVGRDTNEFYLLSDPDLFNNHGLRLADNAAIASHFFKEAAGGEEVLIDYSTSDWFLEASDGPVPYERTWADFKRFFGPPFLALWLAGAATFALVLWRAGRRYGPLAAVAEGPGSSKLVAIRARARLMRLTDQDGALVADYARTRLAALAARLFGPAHAGDERTRARLFARAFPDHYAALDRAEADALALPAKTSAADAIACVDALEQILEKIDHEPR
ncbi:MAG: hypothetical protein KDK10_18255 [Maritimibacter sp.]|nr:hypothetical protein [Maritimibacter sp.]